MTPRLDENAALVALLRCLPKGQRWADVTERILEAGSARAVWDARDSDALLPDPAHDDVIVEAVRDLAEWNQRGWHFLGILAPDYPARLREIHQAPPFLFAAGKLQADDRAVAVVGSRRASEHGRMVATRVATSLAQDGITVLSGLAEGIDSAAHRAALEAGGRTVAVIGTGISRYYPAANRELQDEIANSGLVLSQFWPTGPPQRHNFLMRNAVMSGCGRATVVVEASEQSGARAQARMAVEHGRPVILTDDVLNSNEWAQRLHGRPGVHIAASLTEVMHAVHRVLNQEQAVDQLLDDLVGSSL